MMQGAWQVLQGVWQAVWGAIQNAANTIWGGLQGIYYSVLMPIWLDLQDSWNVLQTTFTTVWNSIKGAAQTAWQGLQNSYNTILAPIFNAILSAINAIEQAWNSVSGIMSSLGGGSVGGFSLPKFASGGYVTQPTVAMIGEAGPEYVIPESQLRAALPGGTQVTQNTTNTSQQQVNQTNNVSFTIENLDTSSDFDWQTNVQRQLQSVVKSLITTA